MPVLSCSFLFPKFWTVRTVHVEYNFFNEFALMNFIKPLTRLVYWKFEILDLCENVGLKPTLLAGRDCRFIFCPFPTTHDTVFLLSMSDPIHLFIRTSCKKRLLWPASCGNRKKKILGLLHTTPHIITSYGRLRLHSVSGNKYVTAKLSVDILRRSQHRFSYRRSVRSRRPFDTLPGCPNAPASAEYL